MLFNNLKQNIKDKTLTPPPKKWKFQKNSKTKINIFLHIEMQHNRSPPLINFIRL